MGPERRAPPSITWCPRCGAMCRGDQTECPVCGARLPSAAPERVDFLGLTLAFWMVPFLALGIACAVLMLCVVLFRWLGGS